MNNYLNKLKNEMSNPLTAVLAIVFTIARVIYGYAWVEAGIEKATTGWLNFQGGHAKGLIAGMAANMTPPKAHGFDPLYLNKLWSWVAIHVFNGMPGVTDFLVPITEMAIGVAMILGFRLFWTAIVALFLNIQFAAAGSANNFGYIWTNIIVMNVAKYAELIGVSGFLGARKEAKTLRKTV